MNDFNPQDDYSLFRFLVKRLVRLNCANNFYTNNQFANLIFGKADSGNMIFITRIWSTYRNYFEHEGIYKRRLKLEKVRRDHPEIFGTASQSPIGSATSEQNQSDHISEMIQALKQEIIAIRQSSRSIRMDSIVSINRISDNYVYAGILHIDNDDEMILNEGAVIAIGPSKIGGAVLSYDQLNNVLYFECPVKLNLSYYYYVEINTTITITPIIDALNTYPRDGMIGIASIIGDKLAFPTRLSVVGQLQSNNLDESQLFAANNALNNNVTYIWGPPGTGKSHCLSVIISELLKKNEKTLIVSIANVAVDQLLSKVLTLIDQQNPFQSSQLINNGDISRIGYITEEPLVKRFDNAPSSKQILNLYRSIRETQQKISNTKDESLKAQLTAQKRAYSREVNEIQKKRIERSILLFTTATKALLDETVSGTEFDNLIIDEASMMSIPYLYALLKRISKRLIIAGDFAQLSPISVSQTSLAEKYLKKDLFSLAGITKSNPKHPSLSILKINRRAINEICDLYNKAFYFNEMLVFRKNDNSKDMGVYYVPLDGKGAEKTNAGSRRNIYSFAVVTDFVKKQLASNKETIGIISPYRAQVNDYKRYFKEQHLPSEITSRLKIGTIHTFQGSEADTILFDTVDNSEVGIGRLFHYEQGERLINVAISRAKDKLIVFGDLQAFYKSNKVTPKVLNVLNRLKEKRVS